MPDGVYGFRFYVFSDLALTLFRTLTILAVQSLTYLRHQTFLTVTCFRSMTSGDFCPTGTSLSRRKNQQSGSRLNLWRTSDTCKFWPNVAPTVFLKIVYNIIFFFRYIYNQIDAQKMLGIPVNRTTGHTCAALK
jgi:hypothetical protein